METPLVAEARRSLFSGPTEVTVTTARSVYDSVRPPADPSQIPSPAKHIPALDGLRGVAILLVLVYHFCEFTLKPHTALYRITGAMWSGVDLFFILSGFLITGILYDTKQSEHYFRNFYARRTLRIFPLYYGFLAVCVIAALVIGVWEPQWRQLLKCQGWLWTYTANIKIAMADSFMVIKGGRLELGHFWSLAVEEHFYLVWPLLILILSRRAAMLACVVIGISALLVRVPFCLGGHLVAAYVLTPCRVDALALGALLALAARGPGSFTRWVNGFGITAACLGGIAILLHHRAPYAYFLTLRYTVTALGYGTLLGMALTPDFGGVVRRALSARWLRLWGKYSYGIYVFHPLVLTLAPLHWMLARWGQGILLATGVTLGGMAISFFTALASWHLYEKRFLKLRRYFGHGQAA